uniref:Uncharacterized protein n=1 Tax=Aegilops tauschii subsp. strangulata TaxID=200361 RepID=A0A453LLR4_AEGTS
KLIALGAVHVVVPGIFPTGCLPIFLPLFGDGDADLDDAGCLKAYNLLPPDQVPQLDAPEAGGSPPAEAPQLDEAHVRGLLRPRVPDGPGAPQVWYQVFFLSLPQTKKVFFLSLALA